MKALDISSILRHRIARIRRSLRRTIQKLQHSPTIHCIGDSHMHVMEHLATTGIIRKTRLEFCIVDGATITGLPNPNSRTQAGPTMYRYLQRVPRSDYILLCLGEVDCGYLIWYRSQKYNESVEQHLELAVRNYCHLIKHASQSTDENVIILSTPPPTITDDQEWGEIANARKEINASQLERTQLNSLFNQKIRAYCETHEFAYIDLDLELLDPESGLVSTQFLNKDPLDHHLDANSFGHLIAAKLKPLGFL